MRKYLSTLHKRSDKHKQNFALFVSGGFTLVMFGLWFFVNYGHTPVVSEVETTPELGGVHEVSPLESLSASAAESWQAVAEGVEKLKSSFSGVGSVDIEQGYEEMKSKTLNMYGQ